MGNAVILADRAEGIRCFDHEHRSFSTTKKFDECQWASHAATNLGIKDFMGHEACVGSAVDEAIGMALQEQEPDLPALLEEAIRDMADPRKAQHWDRPELMTKTRALYELWLRDVQPTLPPTWATQLELHFTVPGTDIEAHVHLDWVGEDGAIDDWKTSTRRLAIGRADTDPQLTWYWLALREVYGHRAPWVGLDGLIYANPPADVLQAYELAGEPKPTKPWLDRQRSTRNDVQAQALVDEIARREEARAWAAKTGIYQTNGRGDFFACGRCPAKPICPSWIGYPQEELLQVNTNLGAG